MVCCLEQLPNQRVGTKATRLLGGRLRSFAPHRHGVDGVLSLSSRIRTLVSVTKCSRHWDSGANQRPGMHCSLNREDDLRILLRGSAFFRPPFQPPLGVLYWQLKEPDAERMVPLTCFAQCVLSSLQGRINGKMDLRRIPNSDLASHHHQHFYFPDRPRKPTNSIAALRSTEDGTGLDP